MKTTRHKTALPNPSQGFANFRQLVFPPEFRIYSESTDGGDQKWRQEIDQMRAWIEETARNLDRAGGDHVTGGDQQDMFKLLAQAATGIWRTAQKVEKSGMDHMGDELRRISRPLESTLMKIEQSGVRISDLTGTPYVVGMVEKVMAFQPTGGLEREMIIETVKPTIFYRDELIQVGEIIVGTPDKDTQ